MTIVEPCTHEFSSNHCSKARARASVTIIRSINRFLPSVGFASSIRKRRFTKMSKVYTALEVSRHNCEKDLWIVYKDGVYDITKFVKEHPGGEEVLINLAGKDATECFDDIGHTVEAVQLRETYKIGTVSGSLSDAPVSAGAQDTTIDDDNWEYEPPKQETSHWLPVFIAAGVVVYGYLFYYFWFS